MLALIFQCSSRNTRFILLNFRLRGDRKLWTFLPQILSIIIFLSSLYLKEIIKWCITSILFRLINWKYSATNFLVAKQWLIVSEHYAWLYLVIVCGQVSWSLYIQDWNKNNELNTRGEGIPINSRMHFNGTILDFIFYYLGDLVKRWKVAY